MNRKIFDKSVAIFIIAFLMLVISTLGSSVNATSTPGKVTGAKVVIKTDANVKVPYLSWNAVKGAEKYEVYRGNGSPTTLLATVKTNYFAGGKDDLLFYNDDYYWVRAISKDGEDGEFSKGFNYFTKPSAPSNFKVTKSGNTYKFIWNKVNGAKRYKIYKYTRTPGTNEITSEYVTSVISNSYTTDYEYYGCLESNQVFAVTAEVEYPTSSYYYNETLESKISNYATYRSNLSAPKGLKVTSKNGKITLSWNSVDGANGYRVYNGNNLLKVTSSNSFTISDLSSSKVYTLKVCAYANNDFNKTKFYSKYSSINAFPNTVSNVKTSLAGKNAVKVTWKAKNNVTGYKIYRSTSKNSGYKLIGTVKSKNTVTYIDKGLASGKIFYYQVVPYLKINGKEYNGGNSNISTIKTFINTKIGGLTVNPKAGISGAYISWNKSSNNLDGYVIYRATSSNGIYKKLKTINSTKTTSYKDINVKKGQTYYYKIVGYKKINGKANYTKYSTMKGVKIAYMKSKTSFPHNTYSYYGDRVTIKKLSIQYKKNTSNSAIYKIKGNLNIDSSSSNKAYFTIDFYDNKNQYVGYDTLIFDRRIGYYNRTVTWENVNAPRGATYFKIQ